MSAQEFLRAELQKLSDQFGITFNYRFDSRSDMHIVSVSPSSLYDDCHYAENEFEITRRFDKEFSPECLLFVVDNDILVGTDTPEFIIKPRNLFKLPAKRKNRWDLNDYAHSHQNYALAA